MGTVLSSASRLLRAYFRSKRGKREVYELDPPPLWDLSREYARESWGARSELLRLPKPYDCASMLKKLLSVPAVDCGGELIISPRPAMCNVHAFNLPFPKHAHCVALDHEHQQRHRASTRRSMSQKPPPGNSAANSLSCLSMSSVSGGTGASPIL